MDLIEAARLGDAARARQELRWARERDSNGRTALMHAAMHGNVRIVRLLRPLEARLQDHKGWTALMYALDNGQLECARLLLLERDIQTGNGETAIDLADRYMERDQSVGKELKRLVMQGNELPTLPEALEKYTLTSCLSSGGFGRIYIAHDAMGQLCLLKVVDYSDRPEIKHYLLMELQNLPQFQHQNILSYLAAYDDEVVKQMYFVMEWCVETLLEEMACYKLPYADLKVWHFIRDISAGLKYLHQKRLIHRDVKPDNIFITCDGLYVLGDFGLVCSDSSTMPMHSNVGTPMYRAPEMHMGLGYDSAIDIWALGFIAYTLLSGKPPFQGLQDVGVRDPPPLDHCSIDLSELIQKMLNKNPNGRPRATEVYRVARDKIMLLQPMISTYANASSRSLTPFFNQVSIMLDEKQVDDSFRQERMTFSDSLSFSVIEPVQDVQDVRKAIAKTEKRIISLRAVLHGLEEDLATQNSEMHASLNRLVEILNKTRKERRADEFKTAFEGLFRLRSRFDDKRRQLFACIDKNNGERHLQASTPAEGHPLHDMLQLRAFEHSLLRTNINISLRRVDDNRRYISILGTLLESAQSQRSFPPVHKTDLAHEIKTLKRDLEETQADITAAISRRK